VGLGGAARPDDPSSTPADGLCRDGHAAKGMQRRAPDVNDAERLLRAFEEGTLIRPAADRPNFVDLARTLASLAGVPGFAPNEEIASHIGDPEHLVFVLADGLGVHFVEEQSEGSWLREHMAMEMQAVFPSTTAVALTSLATGAWMGRHAVTGWHTRLPELGGAVTILPFQRRSDDQPLGEHGVTPEEAFPAPALLGRASRSVASVVPAAIVNSVYSVYSSGGTPRLGYRSLAEAVEQVVDRVEEADGPTHTYVYTPLVDALAHDLGVGHPEVRDGVSAVDELARRLSAEFSDLGIDARIVVSADHGHLDTAPDRRHPLRPSDPLLGMLDGPPSGDVRVIYFHLLEGRHYGFRELFTKRFGERFVLLDADDAERLQLFGPDELTEECRHRIGDMVAISLGRDVMRYSRPQANGGSGNGAFMRQIGQHSGLSPEEMMIPLIVG
jgi:hypothetical protein